MKGKPANLPASVSGRLRNLANRQSGSFELLMRRYALERLLFRLSRSRHRDRFVLKGAMLFSVWLPDPFRPTKDLDLLGFGEPGAPAIEAAFRDICEQKVPDDGLVFDTENMIVETIRDDQEYGGIRVRTKALLGKARIPRKPLKSFDGFGRNGQSKRRSTHLIWCSISRMKSLSLHGVG